MFTVLMVMVVDVIPLGQHYLADPDSRTPVLSALVQPFVTGGWLPPPGPPSQKYIFKTLADGGRKPGDVIVSHKIIKDQVRVQRLYPKVGLAREWNLTYFCEINGPDGPYGVYTDRTALIRVP